MGKTWPKRPKKSHPNAGSDAAPSDEQPQADVNIDGSLGEGGGQIVRSSLALSAVIGRSVRLEKIRYSRSQPGLQAQHLTSAELVAEISSAQLFGARPRSSWLLLNKSEHEHHEPTLPLEATVRTAGATSLVLQAALPAALRYLPSAPVESEAVTLVLIGGTTALFAPTSDYVANVLIPNLKHFGVDLRYKVEKHGFFPRGGGRCTVAVDKQNCLPAPGQADGQKLRVLQPCNLTERGDVLEIGGNVLVSGEDYIGSKLDDHMRHSAVRELQNFARSNEGFPYVTQDSISRQQLGEEASAGKCLCITLYARTSTGTVLGASAIWSEKDANNEARNQGRGPARSRAGSAKEDSWRRTAASTARTAAEDLCTALNSGAAVDTHMADQLCVFMAIANGTSKLLVPRPSLHLRSVVQVCNEFNVNIHLEGSIDAESCMLVCDGMGIRLPP